MGGKGVKRKGEEPPPHFVKGPPSS